MKIKTGGGVFYTNKNIFNLIMMKLFSLKEQKTTPISVSSNLFMKVRLGAIVLYRAIKFGIHLTRCALGGIRPQ